MYSNVFQVWAYKQPAMWKILIVGYIPAAIFCTVGFFTKTEVELPDFNVTLSGEMQNWDQVKGIDIL